MLPPLPVPMFTHARTGNADMPVQLIVIVDDALAVVPATGLTWPKFRFDATAVHVCAGARRGMQTSHIARKTIHNARFMINAPCR